MSEPEVKDFSPSGLTSSRTVDFDLEASRTGRKFCLSDCLRMSKAFVVEHSCRILSYALQGC